MKDQGEELIKCGVRRLVNGVTTEDSCDLPWRHDGLHSLKGVCWPPSIAQLNLFEPCFKCGHQRARHSQTGCEAHHCDCEFFVVGPYVQPMSPKLSLFDHIEKPRHYTLGEVQCIDALVSATIALTGIEAVCTASAIKYLWRWKLKNGLEDLKKARWYLDKLIAREEHASQVRIKAIDALEVSDEE